MKNKRNNSNDVPALLALIGVIIIFIAIVGRGWHTLFVGDGAFIAIFAGLLMAVIATVLAYAIASEQVNSPTAKSTMLAYFFVLFNISALGTINSMFVMFQGANVFREEIDKGASAVVKLRDLGTDAIDLHEYEKFQSNLKEKWRNLKAELENPQLCGQGQVAARRIEERQEVLPSFRILAGGGSCNKLPSLVAAYERQIIELEKISPVVISNKEKIALKLNLKKETSFMLDELASTQKMLNGSYRLADVKARLFDVAERYLISRQELGSMFTTDEKIPFRIETKSISALGDIGQIIPFMATRLTELSTYIYLLIALILDIAVVASFSRVLRSGPSPSQRRFAVAPKQM